jgi:hypothetical protein
MPVGSLAVSPRGTSLSLRAFLAALGEAVREEDFGAGISSSALKEFQAWQLGHRPSDTGDCQPHSRQT